MRQRKLSIGSEQRRILRKEKRYGRRGGSIGLK